jgi:hypothetical protein
MAPNLFNYTVCLYYGMSLPLYVFTTVCLYHCMSLPLYVFTTVCLYYCMSLPLYVFTTVCLYHCMSLLLYVFAVLYVFEVSIHGTKSFQLHRHSTQYIHAYAKYTYMRILHTCLCYSIHTCLC